MPRKGLPNPGLMSSGGAHEAEVWDPRLGRGGRSVCPGSAHGLHSLIGRVDDGHPVCVRPRAGHSARRREAVALGITFPSLDTHRLFPWMGERDDSLLWETYLFIQRSLYERLWRCRSSSSQQPFGQVLLSHFTDGKTQPRDVR